MDRFTFWQRWFVVLSLMIVAFGVFMAIFNQCAIFNLFNNQIDPIFWGVAPIPGAYTQFQRWVYGVLGATMTGLGLMLLFIVRNPFRKHEKWAWNAIAVSLGFWYLLDTAISLYFGVYFNAIFNTLLLVVAIPPLVGTRKKFNIERGLHLK